MSTSELQPDIEDILQVENPEGTEPTVKVKQQGPVHTQTLPYKRATSKTWLGVGTFTDPTGKAHVLRPDKRRGSAFIISPQDFYIAFSANTSQQQSTSAFWPRSVPCPIDATVDVYVSATVGFADISVITQAWATGEGAE